MSSCLLCSVHVSPIVLGTALDLEPPLLWKLEVQSCLGLQEQWNVRCLQLYTSLQGLKGHGSLDSSVSLFGRQILDS